MARRSRGQQLAELNERHELFILEYLRDRNGARAYLAAGYKAANPRQEAWALLREPPVAARLAELSAEKFKALHMDVDEILAQTALIARASIAHLLDAEGKLLPPGELTDQAAASIAGIEVDEIFEGTGAKRAKVGVTRKVRLRDPMPALRLLAEHKKLVKTADAGVNALASMLAERMKAAREARKAKEPKP